MRTLSFPSLSWHHSQGHKVEYSFLQWASCTYMYMTVLSLNGHGTTKHTCVCFNMILRQTLMACGNITMLNTGRKLRLATIPTGQQLTQPSLSMHYRQGKAGATQLQLWLHQKWYYSLPSQKRKRPMTASGDTLPTISTNISSTEGVHLE